MAAAAIIAARKNAKLREEREANMTVDDVRQMYELTMKIQKLRLQPGAQRGTQLLPLATSAG